MLQSKRQINKASAVAAIVIVLALVLVINIFSIQLSARWDITENNDYSISPTTKDLLRNLDDVVNVKAYFTAELPGYLLNRNQDVRDILGEFEAASNSNVVVTYLNPSADETIEEEARGLGIPTLQFNVVEKDKYQVTNGYLGIAVFYGDEQEIIPIVQDTATLEYDLAAAVSRVTRDEVLTIGFLRGRGAFARSSELAQVGTLLERQYRVIDIHIEDGNLIAQDVDALIVPGVKDQLTKREQYAIDQFLMGGGNLLVLAEGTAINGTDLSVEKLDTGIGELLAQYGVRLNKNLALDVSNELAAFRTDQVQFFSQYPFWIKIPKGGFNPDSGIVNKLESVVFTWASTVEVLEEKLPEGTEFVDLIRTTAGGWVQDGDWALSPRQIPVPEEGTQKSHVLATMITGAFSSLFSENTIPGKPGKNEAEEPPTSEERQKFLSGTGEARIIVVGDADFITGSTLGRFQSNAVLFLNLVDALVSDEALIAIRSKAVTDRPLREISDSAKNAVKWLNILGVSALFAGYGMVRFMRRRRNRVVI